MKGKKIIGSVFLMALCAGCGNSHQEKETGIITVDVHADYPEKKLMLQDILEVEYIPLETSDEFITQDYGYSSTTELCLSPRHNQWLRP